MLDVDRLRELAVRPGPTSRTLVRATSGAAFFLQADTAWELFHRLTREEALTYLDVRQKQGFNAVLAVVLPELDAKPLAGPAYGPDGETATAASVAFGSKHFYPNRYGEVPLTDDDPTKPNEKYFEHVDWVVGEASARGLLVILVPSWARYINRGWQGGPLLFDTESAAAYGAFLGRRYPFLPKILGGDSNPVWTEPTQIWGRFRGGGRKPYDLPIPTVMDLPRYESFDLIDAMAQGILETEAPVWQDLGAPVLTYHPTALWLPWSPSALASTFFGDRAWLTLDGCQSGHADYPNIVFDPPLNFWNARASHVPLTEMWSRTPVRPVLDLESHYEDMYNGLNIASGVKWTADDIRSGAWQTVLSGACGIVYGTNAVWQMYDDDRAKSTPQMVAVCGLDAGSSWKRAIHLPGPSYIDILARFVRSLDDSVYHRLEPCQDVVLASDAPTSSQTLDGRIDAMRDVGSSSILVVHSGAGHRFELDLVAAFPKADSLLSAEWLDPRTGETTSIGSVTRKSASFTPPSCGSSKEDWVLVVRAES